jgi:hypothetical protein
VEPGSPFGVESQPGQVPLHRIRQELMPPLDQIWVMWFHASFLGNPCGKLRRLDASPQEWASRKPPGQDLDMKLKDVGSPRWGIGCSNCWPPFVSLRPSLWLLWAALTRLSGFCLQTLSFARPHGNLGTHFRYGSRIPRCMGRVV